MIEKIPITSREQWLGLRQQDVTASVIGALLGVHEYTTPLNLWALKSGLVTEDPEETAPMKRGRLLEPVALQLLREERPRWRVAAGGMYYRDPDARMGATPDAFVTDLDRPGFGICQIKTVDGGKFSRVWRDKEDDGAIRPPLWIVVQAIVEAHLTGANWACVAALTVGFGLDLYVVDIPIHAGLIDRLKGEVAEFWNRVAEGRPYDPDFGKDAALIARMYADDDGRTIDLSARNDLPDLLARRAELKAREADGNAAEKERKVIDVELIAALGHAAAGRLADGTIVEAKTVRRGEYVVKAGSYRSVKVKPGRALAHSATDLSGPF
jgi:predicted phage-related endonuclease